MKLLLYEIYKLSKHKIISLLIPILLICNCWIFLQQELQANRLIIENQELYVAFEAQFRELPVQHAYQQAIEFRNKLSGFSDYVMLQQNRNSEFAHIYESSENFQKYGALFLDSEYANNELLLRLHTQFVLTIINQLEALLEYPDYVDQIEIQASNMLKYSIFNKKDSFSYRNIIKTPNDFSEVKNVPLQLGLDYGVVSNTSYRMTDIIMLIILIILSISIFNTEREQGQYMLLRTMKHGRTSLFFAKLQMLVALSFLLACIFYGSIMLLSHELYGFGDQSRYIQSMGAYKFAHMPLTVNEYLTAFLVGKVIICIVLALLFAYFLLLFTHLSKSLVMIAILLSVSYMAYQFIHPASYINLLKYINIIALLDITNLLTSYVNLNIFGYPVSREIISFIIVIILAILLVVSCIITYIKSIEMHTNSGWFLFQKLMKKAEILFDRSNRSISIIWHEAKKQLWTAKGWVVLACALLICLQDINGASFNMDHDQYHYNEYMDQLTGPLTEEKIMFVEQERARIDNAGNALGSAEMQLRAGDINLEQFNIVHAEIDQLTMKKAAFDSIYAQYLYLIETKDIRNIDAYFVNKISSDYLFNNVNREQINIMILGLLLSIYFASSYTLDSRHQLLLLLKTTKRGRLRLFNTFWLYGIGVGTIILLLLYIPQYVNVVRLYPLIEWQAPIQSLRQYGTLQISLNLRQFVMLVSICQWVGLLAISVVMLLLALWLKKFSLTLLSGLTLVLCPAFTLWLGYDELTKYTLHYTHVLYLMLNQGQISELYMYLAALVVLMIACLYAAWHCYVEGELWGKASFNRRKTKASHVKGVEIE